MNHSDTVEESSSELFVPTTKKLWVDPEIRDQSVSSLTEGKPNQNPTEASPGTGS